MKYIITEKQNKALIKLARNISKIDKLVLYYMKDFEDMCDVPFKDYSHLVAWIIFKDMKDREFKNFEYSELYQVQSIIEEYLRTKHHKVLYNYYLQKCEK